MNVYYPSLLAIERQTMELDAIRCLHCHQTQQLVSHGFIYKKQSCAEPEPVGKRVFCSDRYNRIGCGRTMRLYLDTSVRYLHRSGCTLVAFVLALIAGMPIRQAYQQATGSANPRHAYRWLHRLGAQLSIYRCIAHRPPLPEIAAQPQPSRPARLLSLTSTFKALLNQLGHRPCAIYQLKWQRSFL